MKFKFWLVTIFLISTVADCRAGDAGLRYINTNGVVRCGTDLAAKSYAYKDDAGIWRGVDADWCRLFSTAIFGKNDRFEMVDVKAHNVSQAIAGNKIDIMLGDAPSTATRDVSSKVTQAQLLYYANQMFLAQKIEDATSMEAYKGKKVCTVTNSEEWYNLLNYSEKYNLELRPLLFRNPQVAKEAFLLKRCELLTGSEIYLKSIYEKMADEYNDITLLPEVIAYKPVYAQVDRNNQTLRVVVKWIVNAVVLAESRDINSKNIDIFIGLKDASLINLLGVDPQLWQKFGLKPDWVKKAIADLGNYGEMYENSLGKYSKFNIERNKNRLEEDGGLIMHQSFF